MSKEQEWFSENQKHWNERVDAHLGSALYDMEAFRAGKCSLKPAELESLGDVRGKKLLHLQCHFGQDSISWARRGAEVTAVDFSSEAIKAARALNEEVGSNVEFIECNVYDLEAHLDLAAKGQYDIVFTSYGTIVWLPDLDRWATVVSRYLKPGGTFFIADFHPVIQMLDWEGDFGFMYSYFNVGTPYKEQTEGTYADREAEVNGTEYFWNHNFAELFGALMQQGLKVEEFKEYSYSFWDCFPDLVKGEDGWYRFSKFGDLLPMMYSLKMGK